VSANVGGDTVSATEPDQAAREEPAASHAGAHRLTVAQLLVAIAVLLVAGGVVGYALYGPSGVLRQTVSAPAWQPGAAACRADPLAHVHDPGRLALVAGCATASGLVEQVQYKPGDGDWQVSVAPDPQYQRFLTAADHGLLPVRVIPADLAHVPLPALGQHATFYGAWVLNRNLDGRAEMHPAWRVVAASAAPAGRAPGGSAGPTGPARTPAGRGQAPGLALKVTAPPVVTVGAAFTIKVLCTTGPAGRTVHASLVHLFVEITNSRGAGVRWQARSTDMLGRAGFRLVALDAPGSFTVRIWGSKSGLFQTAVQNLVIRRR
jgi:hypothetical protein